MKYENWLKFAANQNGQNIRLNALINSIQEILNGRSGITRRDLKYFIGKIEEAIGKNNELKEIVRKDYEMTNNEKQEILETIGQALINASNELKGVTERETKTATPSVSKINNNILTGTIVYITEANENRNRFINVLPDGESRTVGFTINHEYPDNSARNLETLGYHFSGDPTAEYLETVNLNELISHRASFILQDDPRYIKKFLKEG